jgi:hypothetical protein
VVRATILAVNTTLADTGPLPPSGGALETSLLTVQIPGTLTAEVAHASTAGQSGAVRSEASVSNLNLSVGGNTLIADVVFSQASVECGQKPSGHTQIVGLVINGQKIAVTGAPNQTIALPNGRVVINEVSSSASGDTREITVNALHVIVDGIADVVISHAHADVHCVQP